VPAVAAPVAARDAVELLAAALAPVERRETHGSWVLLTRDRAYKIKKPVVLDFLDYGTLDRRREMCRAEVEVNRRAAPGVYLGVRAIVPADGGVALAAEDAPDAVEYAVEMRRFDEHATLDATLARGRCALGTIAVVGRAVAAFHDGCAPVRDRGGAEPLRRTIDDNFASLATLLADDAGAGRRLTLAQRFAVAFLGARGRELDARARQGRVRDAHGDLRAEHVVLGRRIAIVDGIEFDPALRQIDAGLDLAFLVMDLHLRGRADLAAELVRGYRSAGGDPGDDQLVAFFAAYRAQVRAKVALIRAGQLEDAAAKAQSHTEATRLLRLGDRLAWKARGPLVLAVAGPSASGKSTLAAALSDVSGLPHRGSDVIRKRLHGLAPTVRAPERAYSAAASEATYRELGKLAAAAHEGAILDATFRRRRDRAAFQEALGPAAARVVFVECRVPRAVLEERSSARLGDPRRVSDATPALAMRQLGEFAPLDEVAPDAHLIIRTDREPSLLVAEVADALDSRGAWRT
jgi:aminoglycoside phosphotransferase family enzyme/predicted kinase